MLADYVLVKTLAQTLVIQSLGVSLRRDPNTHKLPIKGESNG